MDIKKTLFEYQDLDYKNFHKALIPNIPEEKIIGIRTPVLKKLSKEIPKEDLENLTKSLPHKYYEENNLHAFYIASIKDFDLCIEKLEAFLPYIDNWATCDGIRPQCFLKNAERLLPKIKKWLLSDDTYTIRFAIEMLMCYYLDEHFSKDFLYLVASIKSDEYYVNMMIAWYFATALFKKWDEAILIIENNILSPWTHNKAIQKSIESLRITKVQKEYLKTLKRKDAH